VTARGLALDDTVGPYKLIRAIGAGGSARIDLARIDRAYGFQRHVVIKRPLEHLRADRNVAASLRREARIGGRLRHPNLVAVLDAGVHDGYDYLVLEYVQGTSLRDLMQTETGGQVRAVPLAVGLGIVLDIARGLHDAHELADERGEALGLVHRDISPGNVLLGIDGAVKVADFGIAKETRVTTLSGSMHGTVTYMAPEQCRGHAFDRRADIWALGVILYELVTHQRLFWADNDVASLHRVLSGQIARPRKLDPAIAPALEDIIMTAVAQEPTARFASARAFADAIEGHAASHGLVVGARWIARTVEEVVGARAAPWIASTTVVAPPIAEPSLVEVIERDVEPEPELFATFGPADERGGEEGSAPGLAPSPAKRTRWLPYVIGGSVCGIGLGAWIAIQSGDAPVSHPAPAIEPVHMVATPPAPEPAPEPEAKSGIVIDPAGPPTGAPHHAPKKHRVTNRPTAGSNAVAKPPVAEPEPPPTAGSGAKPTHVEWKPSMLLPTDRGSGTTKKP